MEQKMEETKAFSAKQKLNVLIVEDDEDSAVYLEAILARQDVNLYFAVSGKEAIEMVKKHSDIDLILMDIKLPVMDGYEATRKIREFNREVKIIAQTAYALEGDRAKALQAGCDDYISKPIKEKLLLRKLSDFAED